MSILVTGGAGFIGSHTAVELLNAGRDIVIIDNFSNSKPEVLDKIREITGKDFKFYEVDYLNRRELEKVFEENKIEAVLNFAGYKAVGESVKKGEIVAKVYANGKISPELVTDFQKYVKIKISDEAIKTREIIEIIS